MPTFISNTVQVHIAAYQQKENKLKFLLLKRRDDDNIYPLMWQMVTGTIDKGETALNTALRELEEETKLIPKKIWTIPYITFFFNAKEDKIHASPVFGVLVEYYPKVEISSEHQEYEWLSYKKCYNRLELPTHKEGLKIFKEYILDCDNRDRFLVSDSKDLKD
jgi:dihydroneopterin triphosphate diphosphatase